jgi:hypothetical protein
MARHEHGRSLQYEVVLRRISSSKRPSMLSPTPLPEPSSGSLQLDMVQPSKLDISVSSTPRSLRVAPWSGQMNSDNGPSSSRRAASNLVQSPNVVQNPSAGFPRGNSGQSSQDRPAFQARFNDKKPESQPNSGKNCFSVQLCMQKLENAGSFAKCFPAAPTTQ